MTKILKNVFISLFGMFAFLFAGFFFTGCGVDYSKIQLSCDQTSIRLDVGESVDLTFTIENFQKGFSNKIDFNDQSSGMTDVFECSTPVYLDDDKIQVTITGVAGGNGKLEAKTLEAGKTCSVDIFVEQYSQNMSFDNQVLYVSNKTPFLPSQANYIFDTNTTHKELSYYYIDSQVDIDYNAFSITSFQFNEGVDYATFSDGKGQILEVSIHRFDKVTLEKMDEVDVLKLHNGEYVSEINASGQFDMLAVYDYSLAEDGSAKTELYESILYDVSTIHVLPNLQVSVSGGYAASNGNIQFEELESENIRIVPNNNEMNVYVLKIETATDIKTLPVDFKMSKTNNYVDVDFFKSEDYLAYSLEQKENIFYLKIAQNVQTQAKTEFSFEIFYNIAQGINDESVNVSRDFEISVEIAPIDLLVNGTSTPENITLYNYYKFPDYGWNEMVFDVISGLESSPTFDGIWFEYDSSSLEISCEGINVSSGKNYLYKDLTKTFYVRGAYGCSKTEENSPAELKVHLESDILSDGKTEIVLPIKFDIVAGATSIWLDNSYGDVVIDNETGKVKSVNFCLDLYDGEKPFYDETNDKGIAITDAAFQYITYSHEKGTDDVVDIVFNNETVCKKGAEYYYLYFNVVPKAVGKGTYTINLDNGQPLVLNFEVLKSINTDDEPFVLANEGNESVTDFRYSTDFFTGAEMAGEPDYANILNVDIINANKNGAVEFGSKLGIKVVANLIENGVKFSPVANTANIGMSQSEDVYYFTTRENGEAVLRATLTGQKVDDYFASTEESVIYELRIASYSLLQEFYLENVDKNASSNVVYYGGGKANDKTSLTMSAQVDNRQTFGFYKYDFTAAAIQNAYENAQGFQYDEKGNVTLYQYNVASDEVAYELDYDFYSDKYIYYYASTKTGLFKPSTIATIVKNNDPESRKEIRLDITNGLMFYADNKTVNSIDKDGKAVSYTISFDERIFVDSNFVGQFDVESKTYTNMADTDYTLHLNAYVRQRNLTKPYEMRINAEEYQSVERISLASSLDGIDFDNEMREYEIDVYTYPQTSTSKNIEVVFETTKDTPYAFVSKIEKESKGNGLYSINLSCEDFFKNPARFYTGSGKAMDNVVEIDDFLTGKIYIFPSEWGGSVSDIDSDYEPIVIDVQYRNGSKNNPYLIETAEDLKKINENETTLKSHYEISTVIDMANVSNFVPIGILDGEIVGFSGSIVGANSQATIANINVSNKNFVEFVGEKLYGGLFAQLNDNALIENISFAGSFDLDLQSDAFIGLLAAVNRGEILNVGVSIGSSLIDFASTMIDENENETLYFGGVAGINVGSIIQNFNLYDASFDEESAIMDDYIGYNYKTSGSEYVYEDGEKVKLDKDGNLLPDNRDLTGQTPKIMAYFNDFVTINVDENVVYAGGIAGGSSGTIVKILSSQNVLNLYGYTQYSAYTLIKVTGTLLYGDAKEVHIGGAVGAATFSSAGSNASNAKILPIQDKLKEESNNGLNGFNIVDNLLIGGEIDTSSILGNDGWQDYVGGVVGYVDTIDTDAITISNNTSRVFLRAYYNVGGIVGFEMYNMHYGEDFIVGYNNNLVEAIDDGRNAFYSSLIIKNKTFSTQTDPEIDSDYYFYFVGNALSNGREYESLGAAVSYLVRDKVKDLTGNIDASYASTTENYGDFLVVEKSGSIYSCKNQFFFDEKTANIGLDETYMQYKMSSSENGESLPNVYFMYYFSVDGLLNSDAASDNSAIEELNKIKPGSAFYPFKLTSGDVTISTSDINVLTVDLNGVITVKKPGLATIELRSIQNTNSTTKIYVYVVNYFDKNVANSLFYASKSSSSTNLTDGSLSIVYGNSKTNIYMVPTYDTSSFGTYDELGFSISKNGILKYKNVDYVLTKNSQLTVLPEVLSTDNFSKVEVVSQTIVFSKKEKVGDLVDEYLLTPKLEITFKVDDKPYTYVYELDSAIELEVEYRDKATKIYTNSDYVAIKSNEHFDDMVTIESTNSKEMVFYQIFFNGQLVQDRLPSDLGEIVSIDDWKNYINFVGVDNSNSEKFFDLNFSENGDNTFDFVCEVNQASDRFASRFENNIYGEYVVYLYASDLGEDGGVTSSFVIDLTEAELNYVAMKNYSNIADVGVSDDRLVPSQRGLLEIVIDPVEAVFDEVVVSNSELNYVDGATEASLTFVYEKATSEGVEYVLAQNFGTFKNGVLTFSYAELMEYLEELNQTFKDKGEDVSVQYNGKLFVSYYMPANNVADLAPVGFDVKVTYGDENFKPASVRMTTKLGNYAKLVFDDRDAIGDVYYVARGLSYGLTLESHGFAESEISISSSNSTLADISGSNGKYVLNITSNSIPYYDDLGYKIEIETLAKKIVDDVEIITKDTLTVYIMEYTLNYNYVEGQFEDVVKGMQDGVISNAVGNPYSLEFDIFDFLEYDSSNAEVVEEVTKFAGDMTKNVDWKVYYNGVETQLEIGKEPFRTDYYSIDGLIVTPLKIYRSESDIYHFSMDAYYTIKNGVYEYSSLKTSNRIYTEFEFDVHDQSTEDSPIPIYTYEEFINMEEGQWYILLDDIKLLSKEDVAGTENSEFRPLSVEIEGLDGNGKTLSFGGTYSFTDIDRVGIFESVGSDTVLKNINIELSQNTIFNMVEENFEVGLLAAQNNGIITNCQVTSVNNAALSVVSSNSLEGSYVAGLVSTNNAYITHSRSKINIFTNANVAGFVATNSNFGVIASSYFKGGSLKNQTNTTEITSGFVLVNNGRINTSYVSGYADASQMYYAADLNDENANVIMSSYNIAGFVYSNSGEIADCYSNILLKQSGAFAAGFVFENSGNVSRCFSTSVFESKQSSNYGFARTNYIGQIDAAGTNAGVINSCFYLQDADPNNDGDTSDGINTSIGEIIKEEGDTSVDLKALEVVEFANLGEYFGEYVYAQGRDSNAVWFFNNDSTNSAGFGGQLFNTGRLELVAPNIIASSERILDRVESLENESGAGYSRYIYIYKSGSAELGSEENPITISSAEDFEEYIVQENNKADYNFSHYRLVADVDYSDYVYNGQTYKTKFMGYLEGNFMTIDGISFVSSKSLKSAGLFAEIGDVSIHDAIGSVMNFTLKPNAVSFSNASIVGALAGKLNGGNVLNVNVELSNQEQSISDQTVVVGQNLVGGAIGLAVGDYRIENLYSQLSAKARNQEQDSNENSFNQLTNDFSYNSFAGAVVGVLSGIGSFKNGVLDSSVAVLADKAGLMFGLIDEGAKLSNLVIDMQENNIVNAYSYGGLVAGESKGEISDVEINNFDSDGDGVFVNFRKVPFVADAVGGFAGLISGGLVENVTITQNIQVSQSSDTSGIKYLGAVAGCVEKSASFKNITVSADMAGFEYVGGLVGLISSVGEVEFENLNVSSALAINASRVPEIALGGIAGQVSEQSRIVLSQANDRAEYELEDLYNGDDGLFDLKANLKTLKSQLESLKFELEALDSTDTEYETKKNEIEKQILTKEEEILEVENAIPAKRADILNCIGGSGAQAYNNINVTVSALLNVYNSTIKIHVGAIVGANNAALAHNVNDAIMSVSGICEAYDNGKAGLTTISASAIVDEQWEFKIVNDENAAAGKLIESSLYSATNSAYYCDVDIVTTNSSLGNLLRISNFGNAYRIA